VYLRGNIWWLQYFVGGRQINESSKSSDEAEARRQLKVKIGEAAAGQDVTPERATIADLCALVLADYRLRKLRDADTVNWRIEAHIKSPLGSLLASRFTPHQVRQYVELRRKGSASDATINRELAIIRRGFSLALREEPPLVRRAPYIPNWKRTTSGRASSSRPSTVRFATRSRTTSRRYLLWDTTAVTGSGNSANCGGPRLTLNLARFVSRRHRQGQKAADSARVW
jgi:hypothetical protein